MYNLKSAFKKIDMIGKVNESVQNQRLEEILQEVKSDLQTYRQSKQEGQVELDDLYEKFDEIEREIHLLKTNQSKNAIPKSENIPNIPWLREMVNDSQAPCFTSLSYKKILEIWQSIFDSIGLSSKEPILQKYLFPIVENEMVEFTTLELGNLYLNQMGQGFANPEACKWVTNLQDFKFSPTEYEALIEKVIKTAVPDAETHNYQQYYDENRRLFIITLDLHIEKIELVFEIGEYLEQSLITKLVKQIEDEIDSDKSFFYFSSDLGSTLLLVNPYQKNIIEKIFKLKNGLSPILI